MTNPESKSNFLMFQAEDGSTRINVILDGETVWLSQRLIAELYQKDVRTVNYPAASCGASGFSVPA